MPTAHNTRNNQLWVIMPVYNEQESVEHVIHEWLPVLRNSTGGNFTFCVLNDGSKDNTLKILRQMEKNEPELKVIDKKNSGHGQTCIEGYREALANNAEWIFQIDSDGQCDPRFFGEFWVRRNNHPLIYGQRKSRDDGYLRTIMSKIVSLVVWISSGAFVKDANVPYRLMRRETLEAIVNHVPRDFKLANILLSALHQRKFGIHWVPIHFRNRFGGQPSVKTLNFAKQGLILYKQLQSCKWV
jgi:dolichol-phosphate mannosyltransferase